MLLDLDSAKNDVKFRFNYENPKNQTAGWKVDEHFWKTTNSDGDIEFCPKMIQQDGLDYIISGDFGFRTFIYEIKNQREKYFQVYFEILAPKNIKIEIEEVVEGDYQTGKWTGEWNHKGKKYYRFVKSIDFPANVNFPDSFSVTWSVRSKN